MEQQADPAPNKKHARRVAGLVIAVVLAVLAGWALLGNFHPKLVLKTCFQDADGLRAGAKVRLAGVQVGYVRTVEVQPQDRACPATIEMAFTTKYELKIPRDSLVFTSTAGILGETYLQIDASQASGSPIENGGRLPS